MRKTNVFLYILIALTLCCIVIGIVSAVFTFNDKQEYITITIENGGVTTTPRFLYHDYEWSLIVAGTCVLAVSMLFLLLARFVKIKNRQLFAIGAIPAYLACMILHIFAAATYYSYDQSPHYCNYNVPISIDTTCLALMIATATISGALALATIVYVVVASVCAKKDVEKLQSEVISTQEQQPDLSAVATLTDPINRTAELPRISFEDGMQQLLSFKSLYDCGILTEEEFIAQKRRIISSIDNK